MMHGEKGRKPMRRWPTNPDWLRHFESMRKQVLQGCLDDSGAALVEMAASCVVMIAMFFGVFEFGLASYTYHYVSDAAREGARFAMVRGSTSCANTPNLATCNATATQVSNYVKNLGYPGINATANMTVTVTWLTATTVTGGTNTTTTWASCTGTCNLPGNMVNVVVNYGFPLAIPFSSNRIINVTSTAAMVVSQ
jgi:Flp pilus assembly protein TadG